MLTIDDLTAAPHRSAPPVLRGLSLTAAAGEILVVLGDSGCGKTTLLRTIAGLLKPLAGRIIYGDRDLTPLRPADRGVSLVFQAGNAYDHWSVRQHLLHDLKCTPGHDVAALLQRVGLTAEADRFPAELSGGQLQRLSIARSLATRRPILLLDEPLVHLDQRAKRPLLELVEALRDPGRAIVYVTHDLSDAMRMADRIAILHGGAILQVGPPAELYRRPRTIVAADQLSNEPIQLFRDGREGGLLAIDRGEPLLGAGGPILGIRPEAIALAAVETQTPGASMASAEVGRGATSGAMRTIKGTVARVDFLGPSVRVEVRLEGQRPHLVALRPSGEAESLVVGRPIAVVIDLSLSHRFAEADERGG